MKDFKIFNSDKSLVKNYKSLKSKDTGILQDWSLWTVEMHVAAWHAEPEKLARRNNTIKGYCLVKKDYDKQWSQDNYKIVQRRNLCKGPKAMTTKEKISKTKTGVKFTEEHKAALSKSRKGKPKSEEHKQKLREARLKVLAQEQREVTIKESKNVVTINSLVKDPVINGFRITFKDFRDLQEDLKDPNVENRSDLFKIIKECQQYKRNNPLWA